MNISPATAVVMTGGDSADGTDRAGVRPGRFLPARLGITAILFGGAWSLGLMFLALGSGTAAIWPAAGVALAILLLQERSHWPASLLVMALAAFILNIMWGWLWWTSAGLVVAHLLPAALGAALLNRLCGREFSFESFREVTGLAGTAAAGQVLAAALTAVALAIGPGEPWGASWRLWWGPGFLGVLLVAPAVVTGTSALRRRRSGSPAGIAEPATVILLLLLLGWWSSRPPTTIENLMLYSLMAVPLLLWASVRLGMAGTSLAVLLWATPILVNSGLDVRPEVEVHHSLAERIRSVQLLVGVYAGASLLLAAGMEERRRLLTSLREHQENLRLAVRAAEIGLWDWDLTTGRLHHTEEWKRILGYADHEIGEDIEEWQRLLHPEDMPLVMKSMEELLRGERSELTLSFRIRDRKGDWRHVLSRSFLVRDRQGAPQRVRGAHIDITDRHLLQQELAHAQKMQALGQLAGGVAHNFNNLLMVVSLNLQQISDWQNHPEHPPGPEPCRRYAQQIAQAVRMGQDLTRRLLAFCRGQPASPVRLDLNEAVENMSGMLEAVLGRSIRIVRELAAEPVRVRADPGGIEQVIMNLVLNARDAMPQGGTLTIRTAGRQKLPSDCGLHDDRPRYACLTVRDTGRGISEEVRRRLFEPFFTTKPLGQGAGLGLATVYGIVRQAGGQVSVDSAPGRGAAFHVYLPEDDGEQA